MMAEFVLTFATTHDALLAAAACADADVPHEKIPTPRSLSSECGFAVQLICAGDRQLADFIKQNKLACAACYRVAYEGAIRVYYRIPEVK